MLMLKFAVAGACTYSVAAIHVAADNTEDIFEIVLDHVTEIYFHSDQQIPTSNQFDVF